MTKTSPPDWFVAIFRNLVTALQPRKLQPNAVAVYYDALAQLGETKITTAAAVLKRQRFFPTSGEWYAEAMKQHRVVNMVGLPLPVVCPRCENRGLIAVRYHDGSPFDLAICDCADGRLLRRIGVEGVERFISAPHGGRIRLTDENRIGFLEDFAD